MFKRRPKQGPSLSVDNTTASGALGMSFSPMAYRSIPPAVPALPHGPGGMTGERGYAGLPGYIAREQYQGAFSGTPLVQYPAMIPGVQLSNGREGSGVGQRYYTPTATPTLVPGVTQTTRPNNISGPQRWGSAYQGPIGPLDVARLQAGVAAAQVRQSGMAVMGWAKALSPSYGGE